MEERELIDKLVDKLIEIKHKEIEINELQLSLEDYRNLYNKLNRIVVKARDYIISESCYDKYQDEFFNILTPDNCRELLNILEGKYENKQ